MAIPESQLETWSHQGSVKQSSTTYNSIKGTLEASTTPYIGKGYSVFLQGSYGNDTNVYSESDVDVVIKLNDCFLKDLVELPDDQKQACESAFSSAAYTHIDFKKDVLKVLIDAYTNDVVDGNKAIQIKAGGNRRKTDVVVAIQFRRYRRFLSLSDQKYDEGICFYNKVGQLVSNYPKQHSENLTKKHQDTKEWLKPMVRILKNLRQKLVEDKKLDAGIAPSYYLEGLLFNIPNDKFGTSYQATFENAIGWIQREADQEKLVCANWQHWLLRDGRLTSWKPADFEIFLSAAIKLWNNW